MQNKTDAVPVWVMYVSVVVLCVVAYLPAINNSFISDDFTLLSYLRTLDQDPAAIWNTASEFFRSVTYVYFWVTFKLFGLRPELHYLSSIALHVIASLLVFGLVQRVTRNPLTGWVASLFFAVYARHEEAVMWISANNSTIVTLNCLLFLTLWERHLSGSRPRLAYTAAVAMFVVALFSKETAITLIPLAAIRTATVRPAREVIRMVWLLVAIGTAYVVLWLSLSGRNFFVTDGHYDFGLHFVTVYMRSLISLLSSALPFIGAWLIVRRWRHSSDKPVSWNRNALFFLSWICLALVPVSFLTYSKYIPSRNTYFPSVALSALVGILFTSLFACTTLTRVRRAAGLLLVAVLAWNGQYLWRKQDREYVKRAAPTLELLALLKGAEASAGPFLVCGFPLHESIGIAAVTELTTLRSSDVLFKDECNDGTVPFATWQAGELTYSTSFASLATTSSSTP